MERKTEKPGWKFTHIMADGTICETDEELREYIKDRELPDLTKRLMVEFIRKGDEIQRKRLSNGQK